MGQIRSMVNRLLSKPQSRKPRVLTEKEAEWMADYFHDTENEPDYDGYVGKYTLPEEVMQIYIKKYPKAWE
jgi:hypothetical protein